ncbi:MAG: ABC transporter permease, partial [Xanthomonadales bacterium]|nr:ABC transporter permease [Xanthomonadales bacterium]
MIRNLLRRWRRTPLAMLTSLLALAIGLGACATLFSVVHAVLLKPLPVHEPERLVWIENTAAGGGLSDRTSQTNNLIAWQQGVPALESIGAYYGFFEYLPYTLTGQGEPQRLVGVPISQNLLQVLGVQPALGRAFSDEEQSWHGAGPAAVILSDRFWRRRFNAEASVVGQTVTINGAPATVAGVLPAGFDFESVFHPQAGIDLFVPFPLNAETQAEGNTLFAIGRLADDADLTQAQSQIDALNQRLQQLHPERGRFGASLTALNE